MALHVHAPTVRWKRKGTVSCDQGLERVEDLLPRYFHSNVQQLSLRPGHDIRNLEAEVDGEKFIFNQWEQFRAHIRSFADLQMIEGHIREEPLTAEMMDRGTQEMMYRGGAWNRESACCPVCRKNIHEGEWVVILRCEHWLHTDCLEGVGRGDGIRPPGMAICPCCYEYIWG